MQMGIFLASLAGIPVFGWFAKFATFRSIIDAGTGWAIVLVIIAAVKNRRSAFSSRSSDPGDDLPRAGHRRPHAARRAAAAHGRHRGRRSRWSSSSGSTRSSSEGRRARVLHAQLPRGLDVNAVTVQLAVDDPSRRADHVRSVHGDRGLRRRRILRRRARRRVGPVVTSRTGPEVGPLFGVCVAWCA